MKKFGLVLAAVGAIIIAAPSIASAQTVVIKRGGGYTMAITMVTARVPKSADIGIAATIAGIAVMATGS